MRTRPKLEEVQLKQGKVMPGITVTEELLPDPGNTF